MNFLSFFKELKLKKDLLARKPASVDELFEMYADGLYRYALSLVRRDDDAEEIIQNLFLRLVRNPEGIRNVINLKAYLYQSARNAAIDLARSRKQEFSLEEVMGDVAAPDRGENSLELAEAIKNLTPEYQEVVFLKCYQGFSFREIGELLAISQNTAASRYRYALDKLRQLMKVSVRYA